MGRPKSASKPLDVDPSFWHKDSVSLPTAKQSWEVSESTVTTTPKKRRRRTTGSDKENYGLLHNFEGALAPTTSTQKRVRRNPTAKIFTTQRSRKPLLSSSQQHHECPTPTLAAAVPNSFSTTTTTRDSDSGFASDSPQPPTTSLVAKIADEVWSPEGSVLGDSIDNTEDFVKVPDHLRLENEAFGTSWFRESPTKSTIATPTAMLEERMAVARLTPPPTTNATPDYESENEVSEEASASDDSQSSDGEFGILDPFAEAEPRFRRMSTTVSPSTSRAPTEAPQSSETVCEQEKAICPRDVSPQRPPSTALSVITNLDQKPSTQVTLAQSAPATIVPSLQFARPQPTRRSFSRSQSPRKNSGAIDQLFAFFAGKPTPESSPAATPIPSHRNLPHSTVAQSPPTQQCSRASQERQPKPLHDNNISTDLVDTPNLQYFSASNITDRPLASATLQSPNHSTPAPPPADPASVSPDRKRTTSSPTPVQHDTDRVSQPPSQPPSTVLSPSPLFITFRLATPPNALLLPHSHPPTPPNCEQPDSLHFSDPSNTESDSPRPVTSLLSIPTLKTAVRPVTPSPPSAPTDTTEVPQNFLFLHALPPPTPTARTPPPVAPVAPMTLEDVQAFQASSKPTASPPAKKTRGKAKAKAAAVPKRKGRPRKAAQEEPRPSTRALPAWKSTAWSVVDVLDSWWRGDDPRDSVEPSNAATAEPEVQKDVAAVDSRKVVRFSVEPEEVAQVSNTKPVEEPTEIPRVGPEVDSEVKTPLQEDGVGASMQPDGALPPTTVEQVEPVSTLGQASYPAEMEMEIATQSPATKFRSLNEKVRILKFLRRFEPEAQPVVDHELTRTKPVEVEVPVQTGPTEVGTAKEDWEMERPVEEAQLVQEVVAEAQPVAEDLVAQVQTVSEVQDDVQAESAAVILNALESAQVETEGAMEVAVKENEPLVDTIMEDSIITEREADSVPVGEPETIVEALVPAPALSRSPSIPPVEAARAIVPFVRAESPEEGEILEDRQRAESPEEGEIVEHHSPVEDKAEEERWARGESPEEGEIVERKSPSAAPVEVETHAELEKRFAVVSAGPEPVAVVEERAVAPEVVPGQEAVVDSAVEVDAELHMAHPEATEAEPEVLTEKVPAKEDVVARDEAQEEALEVEGDVKMVDQEAVEAGPEEMPAETVVAPDEVSAENLAAPEEVSEEEAVVVEPAVEPDADIHTSQSDVVDAQGETSMVVVPGKEEESREEAAEEAAKFDADAHMAQSDVPVAQPEAEPEVAMEAAHGEYQEAREETMQVEAEVHVLNVEAPEAEPEASMLEVMRKEDKAHEEASKVNTVAHLAQAEVLEAESEAAPETAMEVVNGTEHGPIQHIEEQESASGDVSEEQADVLPSTDEHQTGASAVAMAVTTEEVTVKETEPQEPQEPQEQEVKQPDEMVESAAEVQDVSPIPQSDSTHILSPENGPNVPLDADEEDDVPMEIDGKDEDIPMEIDEEDEMLQHASASPLLQEVAAVMENATANNSSALSPDPTISLAEEEPKPTLAVPVHSFTLPARPVYNAELTGSLVDSTVEMVSSETARPKSPSPELASVAEVAEQPLTHVIDVQAQPVEVQSLQPSPQSTESGAQLAEAPTMEPSSQSIEPEGPPTQPETLPSDTTPAVAATRKETYPTPQIEQQPSAEPAKQEAQGLVTGSDEPCKEGGLVDLTDPKDQEAVVSPYSASAVAEVIIIEEDMPTTETNEQEIHSHQEPEDPAQLVAEPQPKESTHVNSPPPTDAIVTSEAESQPIPQPTENEFEPFDDDHEDWWTEADFPGLTSDHSDYEEALSGFIERDALMDEDLRELSPKADTPELTDEEYIIKLQEQSKAVMEAGLPKYAVSVAEDVEMEDAHGERESGGSGLVEFAREVEEVMDEEMSEQPIEVIEKLVPGAVVKDAVAERVASEGRELVSKSKPSRSLIVRFKYKSSGPCSSSWQGLLEGKQQVNGSLMDVETIQQAVIETETTEGHAKITASPVGKSKPSKIVSFKYKQSSSGKPRSKKLNGKGSKPSKVVCLKVPSLGRQLTFLKDTTIRTDSKTPEQQPNAKAQTDNASPDSEGKTVRIPVPVPVPSSPPHPAVFSAPIRAAAPVRRQSMPVPTPAPAPVFSFSASSPEKLPNLHILPPAASISPVEEVRSLEVEDATPAPKSSSLSQENHDKASLQTPVHDGCSPRHIPSLFATNSFPLAAAVSAEPLTPASPKQILSVDPAPPKQPTVIRFPGLKKSKSSSSRKRVPAATEKHSEEEPKEKPMPETVKPAPILVIDLTGEETVLQVPETEEKEMVIPVAPVPMAAATVQEVEQLSAETTKEKEVPALESGTSVSVPENGPRVEEAATPVLETEMDVSTEPVGSIELENKPTDPEPVTTSMGRVMEAQAMEMEQDEAAEPMEVEEEPPVPHVESDLPPQPIASADQQVEPDCGEVETGLLVHETVPDQEDTQSASLEIQPEAVETEDYRSMEEKDLMIHESEDVGSMEDKDLMSHEPEEPAPVSQPVVTLEPPVPTEEPSSAVEVEITPAEPSPVESSRVKEATIEETPVEEAVVQEAQTSSHQQDNRRSSSVEVEMTSPNQLPNRLSPPPTEKTFSSPAPVPAEELMPPPPPPSKKRKSTSSISSPRSSSKKRKSSSSATSTKSTRSSSHSSRSRKARSPSIQIIPPPVTPRRPKRQKFSGVFQMYQKPFRPLLGVTADVFRMWQNGEVIKQEDAGDDVIIVKRRTF
ncbi:hypothetical protein BJ508DRAFT_365003 [Ascobolus immersus RN42]|uniref:Uncharacterized protein n=1 Tax=Ascobolus immersus RN42 TaxID=1160509 RepID=A0A3N4HU01_ASCIM|nr:hypothetical protein BJ508DRAFT_365003 [Ascobolus immersus RN42]